MNNLIYEKYHLHVDSILKLSKNVYKIYTSDNVYILKFHVDDHQEALISRLNMLNLDLFLLPIKSINRRYIENHQDTYFSLSPFIEDEQYLNKDIRLTFYIKALGYLHHNSLYEVKVSDGFFEESLNYLESLIEENKKKLLAKMEIIERNDYHSPSEWYFIMNYDHFNKALLEASRRLDILENMWSKVTTIKLSLTYQNFDYNHIFPKYNKICSLDKLAIAPSIYDLKYLFDEAFNTKIDIASVFKQYLSIHPLENYEIEWLLTFLFIPNIEFKDNDIDNIESLLTSINYLMEVEQFANKINKLVKVEENSG